MVGVVQPCEKVAAAPVNRRTNMSATAQRLRAKYHGSALAMQIASPENQEQTASGFPLFGDRPSDAGPRKVYAGCRNRSNPFHWCR